MTTPPPLPIPSSPEKRYRVVDAASATPRWSIDADGDLQVLRYTPDLERLLRQTAKLTDGKYTSLYRRETGEFALANGSKTIGSIDLGEQCAQLDGGFPYLMPLKSLIAGTLVLAEMLPDRTWRKGTIRITPAGVRIEDGRFFAPATPALPDRLGGPFGVAGVSEDRTIWIVDSGNAVPVRQPRPLGDLVAEGAHAALVEIEHKWHRIEF